MEVTLSQPLQHASSEAPALKYQGRKTSRAGSEQRRKAILEAALRIVVREGIRGVRHRAVAREAAVPLSATTYYFKDISDLITDTFTLFVEVGAQQYCSLFSNPRLENNPQSAALAGGQEMAMALLLDYLRDQLQHHRDYLLAEQAFRLECLRNEQLKNIASKHDELLLADLANLFERVGSTQPEQDARIMMSVLETAEYEGLMLPDGIFDEPRMRSILERSLDHIFQAVTHTRL